MSPRALSPQGASSQPVLPLHHRSPARSSKIPRAPKSSSNKDLSLSNYLTRSGSGSVSQNTNTSQRQWEGYVYWCVAAKDVPATLVEIDLKALKARDQTFCATLLRTYKQVKSTIYQFWTMSDCGSVSCKKVCFSLITKIDKHKT